MLALVPTNMSFRPPLPRRYRVSDSRLKITDEHVVAYHHLEVNSNAPTPDEKVVIELSSAHALVFFEFLSRFSNEDKLETKTRLRRVSCGTCAAIWRRRWSNRSAQITRIFCRKRETPFETKNNEDMGNSNHGLRLTQPSPQIAIHASRGPGRRAGAPGAIRTHEVREIRRAPRDPLADNSAAARAVYDFVFQKGWML